MDHLYDLSTAYTSAVDDVTAAEAHRLEVIAEEDRKVEAAQAAARRAREELLGYTG